MVSILFLAGCILLPAEEKPIHPNIIYILADDMGYGDVSCYNENSKIKTPNLDKLASEGIRFTDAHTSSAVCTPTRYGILTGRYNWRTELKSGVLSGYSKALIKSERMTVGDLLNYNLPDNAAEDSYSFLPVLKGNDYKNPIREATVHHSLNGRFAIRQGDWKLILWPGSGGWSYPRDNEISENMSRFQLYNLKNDPSEENNLFSDNPAKVNELKELMAKYIEQGRSTPGEKQDNEGMDNWSEIDWIENSD